MPPPSRIDATAFRRRSDGEARPTSSWNLAYEIEFDPDALKDLKKLDRPIQQRLVGFLKHRVAALENPRDLGEPLAGARPGNYWKYRVGDWRIICDIPDHASWCAGTEGRQPARSLSISTTRIRTWPICHDVPVHGDLKGVKPFHWAALTLLWSTLPRPVGQISHGP